MSDSNIFTDDIETEINFFEIEQRAREMRGAAIRHAAKNMRVWLRSTFSFPSVNGRAPA